MAEKVCRIVMIASLCAIPTTGLLLIASIGLKSFGNEIWFIGADLTH
jgi:hypothetical protein